MSRAYSYKGYRIDRGGFVEDLRGIRGDDSLEGWYVDKEESTTLDRRGSGYDTLAQAKEAIDAIKENA